VQGVILTTEFYILTLGGRDMVLGVHWLRTLGPIIWDFLQLTVKLSFLGKTIILKGLNTVGSTMEEGSNFFKASQLSSES
jgi:hypothetical protein